MTSLENLSIKGHVYCIYWNSIPLIFQIHHGKRMSMMLRSHYLGLAVAFDYRCENVFLKCDVN